MNAWRDGGDGPKKPTSRSRQGNPRLLPRACSHAVRTQIGEGDGDGDGKGDIDVLDTTCKKQDYVLYIVYLLPIGCP